MLLSPSVEITSSVAGYNKVGVLEDIYIQEKNNVKKTNVGIYTKERKIVLALDEGDTTLNKLLKNSEFKAIYDDFVNGKIARKFVDELTLEEEAVLRFYTTKEGYLDFNKALRGEIGMTEFYASQEKLMNEALDKLPNHSNQSLLWRGLKNIKLDDIKKMYKEGEVVVEKHFVSTAYNIDDFIKSSRIRNFDYIIKIEGKNGKLIETISTLPEEAEVIFKSNTSFKVEKAGYDLHPDTNYENLDGMPFIWTIKLKEL